MHDSAVYVDQGVFADTVPPKAAARSLIVDASVLITDLKIRRHSSSSYFYTHVVL